MNLESYRKSKGLTQSALAEALGLRSKGYISQLERGVEACSLALALRIEKWSGGEVTAAELVPSAADLLARHSSKPDA